MATITKFTDYAVNSPDFFINFITTEIKLRDVSGLTNGRIKAINISGEHPLVRITESMLKDGKIDTAGFLPAIAVVEDDENEEYTTIGDGMRVPYALGQDFVNTCRATPIKDRIQDGLISDKQLDLIENAIVNNKSRSTSGIGYLLTELEGFFLKENIFVSVWCHSVDERNIIGNVIRSIIFDMKKAMRVAGLKETRVRTSKGLINSNFGRILYGQESIIDFTNYFHNMTVTDEYPRDKLIAESTKISIHDAIDNSTREIYENVNVDPRFKASGYSDQDKANILTGDIE